MILQCFSVEPPEVGAAHSLEPGLMTWIFSISSSSLTGVHTFVVRRPEYFCCSVMNFSFSNPQLVPSGCLAQLLHMSSPHICFLFLIWLFFCDEACGCIFCNIFGCGSMNAGNRVVLFRYGCHRSSESHGHLVDCPIWHPLLLTFPETARCHNIQTAENLNWAVVHYYESMCCPHLADFHLENSATSSLTKCRSRLCKTLNACSSMSERFAHESRVIIACVLPTLPLTLGKATSSLVPRLMLELFWECLDLSTTGAYNEVFETVDMGMSVWRRPT
ncbi:hypothetical protein Pelo_17575 [Pelomyxa schiedti]|nr:hypothetical protein Pelo_17575 [Pelomyxa schiedti]